MELPAAGGMSSRNGDPCVPIVSDKSHSLWS
jgi:hypothetical protein